MQFNFTERELTIKLVYYGPALSGKTTNLQAIHRLVSPETRGRLMNLETRDDRTLFFDLLPLTLTAGNLNLRIKVFTVPGQVMHSATRRLVIAGADGVAFIADSQINETQANQIAFSDMLDNLQANGLKPEKVPIVIQFNKRDLPRIRSDEEIAQLASASSEPIYLSVATRGTGVIDTFLGLLDLTMSRLEAEHSLEERFGLVKSELMNTIRSRIRPHEAAS